MAAEAVTITPHDPRRTAFRAVVAALKADATLAPYVAAWDVRDGDTDAETQELAVDEHAVRLTPVFEREDVAFVDDDGRRVWSCPVLVQVESLVASANIDNAINLAGLVEDAVCALDPSGLPGISWIELSSPAAGLPTDGRIVSAGAFRLMVYVAR